MSMPTIEMQLRSYGHDLADRDRDGQLVTAQGPQSLSPGGRPWGRLALVAALVLFVAGLAGVAIRSTTGDGTATGAASSDAAYALPPAGSSALEYGGDPTAGGSAVYYDDPQGTRFELFTYDRDLMGQTDEQYRTFVESLTTPATATETIEPFGTVVFKCVEGADPSAARAMWAGDARIAVLVETRGSDRPCSERLADLSRQMSELRLASQRDWQAFNLSASTTTP